MNDDYTTLEQSKRLAALGLTAGWPMIVWVRWPYKDSSPYRLELWPEKSPDFRGWPGSWYPAVPLLRALEWLEETHGWRWRKQEDGYFASKVYGTVFRWLAADPLQPTGFVTPSALLDAILDKVEEDAS